MAVAVDPSTTLLQATMPPKALSSSAARAEPVGLAQRVWPAATPQGVLCLTTTAASSLNCRTQLAAA